MFNNGITRFKLAVLTADPNNVSGIKRTYGPLQMMAREDRRLEIVLPNKTADGQWDLSFAWLAGCDALYTFDPFSDRHVEVIALAKTLGLPVWAEWGDMLTAVRPSNPNFHYYADTTRVQKIIHHVEEQAAVVTLPAESLKALLKHPEKSRYIAPTVPFGYWGGPRQRVITWRGLSSHEEDIESVQEQLFELSRLPQLSNWDWIFMGDPPWRVCNIIKSERLVIIPYLPSPFHSMAKWDSFKPFLNICPLADNPFNRGKTPEAWMEAACIGAACIAPSYLSEWHRPGCILYDTPRHFASCVLEACAIFNKETLHPNVEIARAAMEKDHSLAEANRVRWEVLNELVERRPGI